MVQSCALSEEAIVVWIEFPEPEAREGSDVISMGISNSVATSDERAIGEDGS